MSCFGKFWSRKTESCGGTKRGSGGVEEAKASAATEVLAAAEVSAKENVRPLMLNL